MNIRNIHSFYIIKQVLSLLLFLSICTYTNAQKNAGDCLVKNKKAEKMLSVAIQNLQSGKRDEAYDLLMEIVKTVETEYVEAYYELAMLNYHDANKKTNLTKPKLRAQKENRAIDLFQEVVNICPSYEDFRSYYYLGEVYFLKGDYMSAEPLYQTFLAENKYSSEDKKVVAKRMKTISLFFDILHNPVPFDPVPVNGVCTKRDEYLPMISPDGMYIYYTQRYFDNTKFKDKDNYVESFTVSERQSDLKSFDELFSKGIAMKPPFNDGRNQGGVALTIDNNHLYITICELVAMRSANGGSYENCDIYQSDNINGNWTVPANLGPNVNGKYTWESQPTVSADGKTLYFTTIRRDNIDFIESFPTSDIYYSEKQEDGTWGQAKNLGPTINTGGNEKTPFMHSDSKTLYFASDGWPGMGGYDIFLSKLKRNTWTAPKNIGYPINNETDNLGLIVSTFQNKAYFSSKQFEGEGGLDILSFELPKDARPEKVLFVKGSLVDDKGKELTDATIEMKSSVTSEVTLGMVDKKTGKYAVAVAVENDEEFLMTVKKENYAFSSAYIKPTEEMIITPIEISREVKEIEVGQTVEIHDIHFASTEWMFDEASMLILENFAKFLEENPKIIVEIHGHTDSEGDAKTNKILSEKRAKSVRSYLMLIDVPGERMPKVVGHGEESPVATNKTPEGRAKNRRTEFVIIRK